ncbi:hypothetical protein ONR57_06510 [Hoyosella sp. YIM 151337]|uniref:hypothetical protein n=1 Tax=Hoyosella sp. YIM 151337 TaxID=2992742 RepID=UPI002235F734|nr:hypothetical protein [Hoyosella sp. YIM 151337]MCW4352945.1 hypothetical protein [Hoyosella sp. YIM 151337]
MKAAKVAAHYATDADDLRHILSMLGLLEGCSEEPADASGAAHNGHSAHNGNGYSVPQTSVMDRLSALEFGPEDPGYAAGAATC